jgi:hypothetical protein
LNREKYSLNCYSKIPEDFFIKMGTPLQRAQAIDAVFRDSAIPAMKMNDKSIVFQSVSIFDRYFQSEFRAY